jgi:hypothetical protein
MGFAKDIAAGGSAMHGTFNGIHLDRIISITTDPAGNSTLDDSRD